ncbi:MAG: hypothetical protein M1822_001611 [Bathelium mastoideum]|nr:MAG: hypothetical protein M1822_001611 [Bathelium mastoideum]
MFIPLVLFVGANAALANGAAVLRNRDTETVGQLFAYGADIEGLPVFYGDGVAYIGNSAPSGIDVARNVTFYHPSSSNMSLIADPTESVNAWPSPALYVNDAPDTFAPVGFIDSESSKNATTETNFLIFGSVVSYEDSSGTLHSQFYATSTSVNGTYKLMWNTNNTFEADSTPVVLKNLSPPSIP